MGHFSRSLSLLSWPLRALALLAQELLSLGRSARGWRFRPSALGDCVLWLRPDAGISSTWGLVTCWADRRRGVTLAARAPTDCPTLVDTSSSHYQRPAVRFDEGGGLLETLGTANMKLDGELTVFVVLSPGRPLARAWSVARMSDASLHATRWRPRQPRAVAAYPRVRALTWIGRQSSLGGESVEAMVGIELDGHNELLAAIDERELHATGIRLMTARPYVLGLVVTGRAARVLVNGARVKTFTIGRELVGAFAAKLRLGTGRGSVDRFSGDIGDVVVYRRALDALECAAVTAALSRRYGIGRPRTPRAIDRLRRVLHRVRDRLRDFCYGTPRPE